MSQIKNIQTAKGGLSALFGSPSRTPETETPKTDKVDDTPTSTEEIVETLSDETKEALQKEIQRRQYLKAGRPPKGATEKTGGYVRMTFLISPEKQAKLRDIALREGLFIKEVLDRGIDMVISDYESKEGRL